MKTKQAIKTAAFIIGAFALLFAACKKTNAPTFDDIKQQRLDWNLKTLVDAYESAGFTNPNWDASAKSALTEFARARARVLDVNEPDGEIISTNSALAVQAGCDDPMVNYLFIKYSMAQTNSKEAFIDAFCKAAEAMEKSSYPEVRKFYVGFRAVQQFAWANNYPTNAPAELDVIRHQMIHHFESMLNDKTIPIGEIYDATHEFMEMWAGSKEAYSAYWTCVEPLISKNWPDEASSWLLKGEAYYRLAWLARGGGYADKVTTEGWKAFGEKLAEAETAAKKAWSLNSSNVNIPILMIRIDEGEQKDRSDMEIWFNRAMKIDPNNYEACESKLHFLYPQWYGSREDMIAFGKECVASTNWGGRVPLILSDAHREYQLYLQDSEEKTNYWKQPDVWPDIKASFDRFFELNPSYVSWHHNYAYYAYLCGQWDEFLHQTTLFTEGTNYDYFGGKAQFDHIVELAKNHGNDQTLDSK